MSFFLLKQQRQRQIARDKAGRAGRVHAVVFEGGEAFRNGLSPVDCPYVLGTGKWRAWYVGWAALYDRMHPYG